MVLSVFSLFATFWSYHVRSKQYFRPLLSVSTFLQFITWILLITTKLVVYVISFINFPGLFFVPVVIQFFVTATVLSFTKVSPSFLGTPWPDRLIHCMVCCVLPLAVSDDPYLPIKIEIDNLDDSGIYSDGSISSLQSFNSIIKSLRESDRKTLHRSNTVMEFERKSRYEMMLALGLYTFECFSVTTFSALMYQFYHFDRYRQFLEEHFLKEILDFASYLPAGVLGVYMSLYFLVMIVVLLSSVLIITYYRLLHPRVKMFAAYQKKSQTRHSSISLRTIGSEYWENTASSPLACSSRSAGSPLACSSRSAGSPLACSSRSSRRLSLAPLPPSSCQTIVEQTHEIYV